MIANEYPRRKCPTSIGSRKMMAKNMRTHSAGLQYHHPLISPRSPQVLGRGKQMKAGVYNHGLTSGVPPLLVASPLTERAIWAAESQRQAYPSLCPALWARSQRDRLGELAGTGAPRSLAKLQHVLMILAFSEVKNVHDSLYLTRRAGFSHAVWLVADVSQLLL